MNEYVIFCDSACDIEPQVLAEWGVELENLSYSFGDEDRIYMDNELAPKDFYDRMRAGGVAKTAAVNSETFRVSFESILKQGKDILYLGFSSGLSSTFNAGRLAMEQLREEYPEHKMIAVDSLCASAGFGLFVYLVAEQKKKGLDIEVPNH